MNRAVVDKLTTALLYEGYMLYPYRPSVKNKQRWTFGGIYPQTWSEAQGGTEAFLMQTECLIEGINPSVHIIVRFLQLIERTVGKSQGGDFPKVDKLDVGEKRYQPWQEAIEREIDLGQFPISQLLSSIQKSLSFPAKQTEEILRGEDGAIAGKLWRRQEALEVSITVHAAPLGETLAKLTVNIANRTALPGPPTQNRDEILLSSLVSTHTVLGIESGEFISLTDPPIPLKDFAANCKNIGAWPVLVGTEPQRDTILSSPIILSDYPELAPESPGDLFDATEIDEILSLRIMTLTDDEKKTAAAVDPRVSEMLKRTESLARQQMMNLHGAIRGMKMIEEEPTP